MNIKLCNLKSEYFKQNGSFNIDFGDGQNAVISAMNGIGKTRVADAFYWLVRGKNSEGKDDFGIWPVDLNNQKITGVTVKVEGVLVFGAETHRLRKELHEKIVKKTKEIIGYETECYIDDVPYKVGAFEDWIEERLPAETCKLLTDLHYFNRDNTQWGWHNRRKILMEMAGKIGKPKGFDELLKAAGTRTVSQYKGVLQDNKKRLEQDRDEIGPAINENHRLLNGLSSQETTDVEKLKASRNDLIARTSKISDDRDYALAQQQVHEKQQKAINDIELNIAKRKLTLENDTSGISDFIDKKSELQKALAEHQTQVENAERTRNKKAQEVADHKEAQEKHIKARNDCKAELDRAKDDIELKKFAGQKDPTTCYACGQSLPQEKIAEMAQNKAATLKELTEKRAAKIDEICKRGFRTRDMIKEEELIIKALQAELKSLEEHYGRLVAEHQELAAKTKAEIADLESRINNREKPKPEDDFECKKLTALLTKAKAELRPPASETLKELDDRRKELDDAVKQLDRALANVDTAKNIKARIGKLEQKQKTISQQIADIDRQLDEIGQYTLAESQLIEDTVNSRFKHVKYVLFKRYQNGNIEDDCVATLSGVAYGDMSYGQRIFAGIDVINALSKHYGISVALFVDNAEGYTLPIEAQGQVIQLKAVPGRKTLKVEIEKVAA